MSADHWPPARHVIVAFPTSLCEASQEYSTRLPTVGLLGEVRYWKLPLRGATGSGHNLSAEAKYYNYIVTTAKSSTTTTPVYLLIN